MLAIHRTKPVRMAYQIVIESTGLMLRSVAIASSSLKKVCPVSPVNSRPTRNAPVDTTSTLPIAAAS